MSRNYPTTRRGSGVRDLQGIQDRCVVEEETGCWRWAGTYSVSKERSISPFPTVCLPGGVLEDRRLTMPAGKAAWLLAGNKLRPGQVVYRHHCGRCDCVNPAHARAGTRKEMFAHQKATGWLRGNPDRALVNAKNRLAMVTPKGIVQRAEAMFAAGVLQKDIRAELGLQQSTAVLIKRGLHPHSTNRVHTLRGASVFNLGGRA